MQKQNYVSLPITQFLPITELVMTVPAPTEVPLLIKTFSSNTQSLQKGNLISNSPSRKCKILQTSFTQTLPDVTVIQFISFLV